MIKSLLIAHRTMKLKSKPFICSTLFILCIAFNLWGFDQRRGVFTSGHSIMVNGSTTNIGVMGGFLGGGASTNGSLTNDHRFTGIYPINHQLSLQIVKYVRLSFRGSGPSEAPHRIFVELLENKPTSSPEISATTPLCLTPTREISAGAPPPLKVP